MKLYYDFSGIDDFEYEISVFDIQRFAYHKLHLKISRNEAKYYGEIYREEINKFYEDDAFIDYKENFGEAVISEARAKAYRRIMAEENLIMGNTNEYTGIRKRNSINKK